MNTATASAQPLPAVQNDDGRPAIGFWTRVSFTFVHHVVAILLRILTLRGLYAFGRAFGTLEWLTNYKRRRRFSQAMSRAALQRPSRAQRRRAAREHFCQTRCDKLIYLILDQLPREKAVALFSIENQHLLDVALAHGNGVYIALSHHGPHHVTGMMLALCGYKIIGVRDRREGGIRRYVQDRFDRKYPEFQRLRMLFADSFPREIYRCLQEECVVASAIDVSRKRHATQRAIEIEAFGERRPFLTGPLHIAMRCGAPVLQGFVVPYKQFHYGLKIVDVLIEADCSGDAESAIERAIRTYTANLEAHVRANPTLISRI